MSVEAKSEPKFFAVNKKSDWKKGYMDNLVLSQDSAGIEIASRTCYKVQNAVSMKELTEGAEILDAALGNAGILYMLCPGGYLWIYDMDRNSAEKYDDMDGDITFHGAERLNLSGGILYVIGTLPGDDYKGSITAIDLQTLEIVWKSDTYFFPLDSASDEKDNLYLLDKNTMAVVKVDKDGNFVDRFAVDPVQIDIKFIAVYKEDELYAYDSGKSKTVFKINLKSKTVINMKIPSHPSREIIDFSTDSSGNIYMLEFLDSAGGNSGGRCLTRYSVEGDSWQEELLYEGSLDSITMDCCRKICVICNENKKLLFLDPVRTRNAIDKELLPQGTYISHPFDSTAYGMKWHRITLLLNIPEDTQVLVYFLTSDEKLAVSGKDYLKFPWTEPFTNPRDALINAPMGRFLWVRIDLIGTQHLSPAVREIMVFFPRTSYLRYLPAIYQEDSESRSFLEGFLSIFENFFTAAEAQIDNIGALFGADSAPAEFLNYLASWLSLPVSEYWEEARVREFIRKASDIYKRRGTRDGLKEILEIFLGFKVFIVENFQVKKVKRQMDQFQKEKLEDFFGNDPYGFHVFVSKVKTERNKRFHVRLLSEKELTEVNRIIQVEKPAFTKAGVITLEPYIYLGGHTYLGINTCLSRQEQRLDKGEGLRNDTDYIDVGDMTVDLTR